MADEFYRLEFRYEDEPGEWMIWADYPLNKSGRAAVISAYDRLKQLSKILEARILVCNPVGHFIKEAEGENNG